jgi:hypothetical protein
MHLKTNLNVMKSQNSTPDLRNANGKRDQNRLKIEATHKHKYIDAYYQQMIVCDNGSWKGLIVDNTSSNKKPKKYTVQNGYKDQWERII